MKVGTTYMLADRCRTPTEAFDEMRSAIARAERKGVMDFALHVECRRPREIIVFASLLADRRDSLADQLDELRKLLP